MKLWSIKGSYHVHHYSIAGTKSEGFARQTRAYIEKNGKPLKTGIEKSIIYENIIVHRRQIHSNRAGSDALYIGAFDLIPEVKMHRDTGANIANSIPFLTGVLLTLIIKIILGT